MNWFESGGESYARFRPTYPPEVAQRLAEAAPGSSLAVDVGCGTGLFTIQLAAWFDAVVGVDGSADQIAHALAHQRVRYVHAPAEHLPIDDGSADLVAAAQAAHWFDLPEFYREVRRVAAPGGILALITYGYPRIAGAVGQRFRQFHDDEIGAYWPDSRRLVDSGYRDIPFPFEEIPLEAPAIEKDVTLAQLLGYVSTWSAIRAAAAAGRDDLRIAFERDVTHLWGEPDDVQRMTLPVRLRVGRV